MIKIDSEGNEEWKRIYGGEYRDAGNFVQQTNDEGYIIIGYREFPYNYPVQQRDVWLIKTGNKPLSNNIAKQIENILVNHRSNLYSNQIFVNLFAKILNKVIKLG